MRRSTAKPIQDAITWFERVILWGGIIGGIAVTVIQLFWPRILCVDLGPTSDWALGAFGAFGTMSGFALASLALVASMSENSIVKFRMSSPPGHTAFKALMMSTWFWLIPAVAALISVVLESTVLEAIVLGGALLGICSSIRAILALSMLLLPFMQK